MKTFLINLDRAAERLRATDAHLRSLGIVYERVRAVDGRALSASERRRLSRPIRFFLLHARRPQPAEIGCALSHQRVYGRMAADTVPLALVLEDDARLDPVRLADSLARIRADHRPEIPQVWLLCGGNAPVPDAEARALVPVRPDASCTVAYVLNLAAARRLRRLNGRVQALADVWGRWAACGIGVKWVTPFAAGSAAGASQIGWEAPRRARWGWYRALWHLRHAAGRALDRLLLRFLGH